MPWAKLDERYAEHRKVRLLTDAEFRLDVSAICFSALNLLDGHLSEEELALAADIKKPADAASGLVKRGRWHLPGHDCDSKYCYPIKSGYLIHDYLAYNPSAESVREKRKLLADRGRKGGAANKPAGSLRSV